MRDYGFIRLTPTTRKLHKFLGNCRICHRAMSVCVWTMHHMSSNLTESTPIFERIPRSLPLPIAPSPSLLTFPSPPPPPPPPPEETACALGSSVDRFVQACAVRYRAGRRRIARVVCALKIPTGFYVRVCFGWNRCGNGVGFASCFWKLYFSFFFLFFSFDFLCFVYPHCSYFCGVIYVLYHHAMCFPVLTG